MDLFGCGLSGCWKYVLSIFALAFMASALEDFLHALCKAFSFFEWHL
jgi:hypothetical protein